MFTIGPYTLTEDEVRRRKTYLEITPTDERRLREAHELLQPHAREIIDRFYAHLLSQEHTRGLLSAPGLVERLKEIQARYFSELTSGRYDLAYFENRLKVGLAHQRAGLAPEWYMGAYLKYLHIATDVLNRAFAQEPERFFRTLVSFTKVVYLDMGLALDAYFHTSQDQLVRLQAAKQQLTDMIVHDLNNPLAGIVAFLRHIESAPGGVSPSVREALDEALRRCDDLSHMILNVLQVSRAEVGRLEACVETVDLAEIARAGVAAFRLVAEHGGRPLALEAPASLAVRADATLVRRVLDNLLRNALRHTPTGTRVTVKVEKAPPAGARLVVADDGPGIPAAAQPLLFERYADAALREAGVRVDTGLGLAFCKAAADAMGARIAVESDGKRGTAFVMTLA